MVLTIELNPFAFGVLQAYVGPHDRDSLIAFILVSVCLKYYAYAMDALHNVGALDPNHVPQR